MGSNCFSDCHRPFGVLLLHGSRVASQMFSVVQPRTLMLEVKVECSAVPHQTLGEKPKVAFLVVSLLKRVLKQFHVTVALKMFVFPNGYILGHHTKIPMLMMKILWG